MIQYAVKDHVPGRIRIEIPLLKKMALTDLKRLADVSDYMSKGAAHEVR